MIRETDDVIDQIMPGQSGSSLTDDMDKSGDDMDKSGDEMDKSSDDMDKSGDDMDKSGDDMDKSSDDMDKSGDDMDKSSDDMDKSGDDMDKSGDDMDKSSDDMDKSGDDMDKSSDDMDKSGDDMDKSGDDMDKSGDEMDKSGDDTDESGDDSEESEEKFAADDSEDEFYYYVSRGSLIKVRKGFPADRTAISRAGGRDYFYNPATNTLYYVRFNTVVKEVLGSGDEPETIIDRILASGNMVVDQKQGKIYLTDMIAGTIISYDVRTMRRRNLYSQLRTPDNLAFLDNFR